MECPNCNHITVVLETRLNKDGLNLRRRQCIKCYAKYKTIEIIDGIKKEKFRYEKFPK